MIVFFFLFSVGTCANDVNFQAYLLEGIARWNEDRANEAYDYDKTLLRSYDSEMKFAVNTLTKKYLGVEYMDFKQCGKYTGQLINQIKFNTKYS